MKRVLFYFFLSLFVVKYGHGQELHKVSGYVRSSVDNAPLVGAEVKVGNTTKPVLTDSLGFFSVNVSGNGRSIAVSYIGMETIKQEIGNQNSLEILLKPSSNTLDEVVTVAYSTVKKSGYPGAVAIIDGKKLSDRLTPNLSNALQGLATGLQTTSSNGQPGNGSTLRIRGVGSVSASSAPLIVVDGAPYDGDINALNVNDIASISVLKDAAAANLYGSLAGNGVIIVTTKKGTGKNQPSISIDLNQGWSSRAVKDYNQVNTDQYFQLYWEALRNKQLTNGLSPADAANTASGRLVSDLGINPYGAQYPRPVGTDGKLVAGAKALWDNSWQDAVTRIGKYRQAQLTFAGASDKGSYYVSANVLDNQGAFIYSGFKRYSLRSNLSMNVTKWLTAGVDLSLGYTDQDYPTSSDSKTTNIVLFGRTIPSFYPIYQRNPDGSFILDGSGNKIVDYGAYRPASALARTNLIGTLPLDRSKNQNDNVSIRSYLKAQLTKALQFKTTYNVDYRNANSLSYTNPLYGDDAAIGGSIQKSNSRTLSYTYNNILNYVQDFAGSHHVDVLLGQEYYYYNSSSLGGSRQNFALPGLYEPIAASVLNNFYGQSDNYRKLSFFAQGQYNFLNKYYFTSSIRRDGSARFSPDKRWGTFWSVGASWRIAQESFLKNIPWLNALTLKASYGGSGNDNLSTYYAYQALYAINNNLGNGGVVASKLGTPDLKWESNLNANIGLDFGILNNRISGTINYYSRRSKDLLFPRPLAPSTGFTSYNQNIGSLRNNGIEIELNAVPVVTNTFRWDVSINATHNSNVVTKLPQKEIISGTKKLMVGHSIYDFFIRQWAGVDPANGNPLWYKDDGNGGKTTTNVYSQATQYYSGSALPDWYGGITNTFNYKGVELSFLLSYNLGGKLLDGDYPSLLTGGSSPGRSIGTELLNRWTPENTNTNVPRLTTDNNNWTSTSTRFLYSASYARLKTLSLGYNLPAALLQKASLKQVKVYVSAENLFTIYGHQGMDPEQAVDGTTYFQYPAMKTISVGLKVGL